jgi:hypothetical protein
VLLFVFWYCHKRGREVRLEKEKLASESDVESSSSLEDSIIEDNPEQARLEGALNRPAPASVPLPETPK